jgi:hypothetical protein
MEEATPLEEYCIELLRNVDVIVEYDSGSEYGRGYLAGMKACFKMARRWKEQEKP